MGDGLPQPKVVNTLANRGRQIDAATEAALAPVPVTPVVAPATVPVAPAKPLTVSEAEAKAAKYKAEREAFDAEAKKGLPKPTGILNRLFGP